MILFSEGMIFIKVARVNYHLYRKLKSEYIVWYRLRCELNIILPIVDYKSVSNILNMTSNNESIFMIPILGFVLYPSYR